MARTSLARPMGWASAYIERLQHGETVSFRPRGASMEGKISSGQLCTVAPLTDGASLRVGDIVLCRVGRAEYLHLIHATADGRFLIGNNRGRINGWVVPRAIYGLCVAVDGVPRR